MFDCKSASQFKENNLPSSKLLICYTKALNKSRTWAIQTHSKSYQLWCPRLISDFCSRLDSGPVNICIVRGQL